MVGGAHHEAGAYLVPDLLEIIQAAFSVAQLHAVGMQAAVVGFAGGFMAQKVAVGPCVKKGLVALPGLFPDGQGDGAVRKPPPDLRDNGADPRVGVIGVLAPLQDKGAESKFVSVSGTGENLLPGQAVAFCLLITFPDATIVAVIAAYVGKFN